MKTHPHLLVRDALAELFVRSAAGDSDARRDVAALHAWSLGGGDPPEIRAEDGAALFEGKELAATFEALDDYARDRARRFAAACSWLADEPRASDPLEQARAAWDAGLFFEVHELIEPVWLEAKGARRELLQGVIMAGAAMHHLSEGNLAGARGLLGDASKRLADCGDAEAMNFSAFARELGALRERILSGSVRDIADVGDLPRLERV
jgi:hypothetical protein